MTDGPYSRVYWKVMQDTDFDGIREDMRLFGSWSLMLVVADMAYPAPAFVPPTVPKAAVKRLVDAGLVTLLPGHRYSIRGQEAERAKRSETGRNASAKRWHSERSPSRAEQSNSKAETSTARGIASGEPRGGPMIPFRDLVPPPTFNPAPKPSQAKGRAS